MIDVILFPLYISNDEEEIGVQNFGFTTETYDPSKPDAIVFPSPNQADRYSYRDSYLEGSRRPPSHTFGNQIANEAAKKQAEKHKNSAFWGNLNNDTNGVSRSSSGGGQFQLQPIVDNLDTSQQVNFQMGNILRYSGH